MEETAATSTNGNHDVEMSGSTPSVAPGKRKRDPTDDGEDVEGADTKGPITVDTSKSESQPKHNQHGLVRTCFAALNT